MDQSKTGIRNEVMDANKENRELSNTDISEPKHLNRTTLLRLQSKTKVVPLNSVENSLSDGAKSTSQSKTINSCISSRMKSIQPILRISMPRKSMTKWKRESLTLNVNPLPKKVSTQPSKARKRKSIQSKLPHQCQVTGNEATGSKKTFAMPSDKFRCSLCSKSFFYKTTLEAHTKTHAGANSCQYCQKNFALPTALVNHLRDHCTNISIAERKKLLAANEKTPNLDCTSRSQRTPKKTPNSVKHLTDELIEFVSRSCSASQSNRVIDSLSEYFPPIKGVYQTPKKVIKCYNCGQNFKHAFLFATHAELCAVDSKK